MANRTPLVIDGGQTQRLQTGDTLSVGDFLASGQITSTVSTGTAPFVVSSTTNVVNLNASSLSGATFAAPGPIGSGTPDTGAFTTVSATTFTGALSGNATTATSATSATNATNSAITNNTASSATWYPAFVSANTGNLPITVDSSVFTFVPSTGTLSATTFVGALSGNATTATSATTATTATTATNANNVNLANDTGVGPDYLVFTNTATGNQPLKTNTGISANPSTATITATTFSGALSGNATTATTAGNVTGTVTIAHGGTGQVTASDAFNALNPMTTTGDLIYESATNVASRLGIGSSGQFLKVAGGIPAWSTLSSGDVTTALTYTPVNKAGDTMSGYLILNADPTTALGAATKQYVDASAASLNVHAAAQAATTADLSAVSYTDGTTDQNGGLGIGAHLTGPQAVLVVDGYTPAHNDRILVKDQTTQTQNGIYSLTTVGVASVTAWILTRVTDDNDSIINQLTPGDYVFISGGTTQHGSGYVETAIGTASIGETGAIKIGTDNIVYAQFSGGTSYSAGAGLQLIGTTFSLPTVGSAGTYTSVTTDAYGRVSGGSNPTPPLATTSTNSAITVSSTNATFYPTFVSATSGNLPDLTATLLTFNPSTNTLSTTTFVGALSGNADTATTATTASNTTITATSANATYYPTFVNATSGNLSHDVSTGLTFNPNSNNLTATTFTGALSGNATSATVLATPRAIYGNTFDGSAALTQVIASTYGGTGNGFTKFSGPAASEKTFTLPNASDTVACLGQVQTFTKTQSATVTGLVVSGNAIAIDLSLSNNFSVTLQATTTQTLNNPTNAVAGTSGQIAVTQNATPSLLNFAANWTPISSVTAVSSVAGAVSLITYYVVDSTHVWYGISSSNSSNVLSFNTRTGAVTLASGDVSPFAPTLTGGGASGSWGISITGSSASCTGNAATATTATNSTITAVSTNATYYPTFVSATSGNLPIDVDADLTYNPSTNKLTTGALTVNGLVVATNTIEALQSDNTSAVKDHYSFARGTGGGTSFDLQTTGDTANGVASMGMYLGGTNLLNFTSAGVAVTGTLTGTSSNATGIIYNGTAASAYFTNTFNNTASTGYTNITLQAKNATVTSNGFLNYAPGLFLRVGTSNTDPVDFNINGSTVGLFSTTGLAVTGTLSCSGNFTTSATNVVLGADTGRFGASGVRFRSASGNTAVTIMPTAGGTNTSDFRMYNFDDVTGTNLGSVDFNFSSLTNFQLQPVNWGTGTLPTTFSIGLNTAVTGTLSATKATAGDVITFTNAAGSNKTGYLYSSSQFISLNDAAALGGNGFLIDSTNGFAYQRIGGSNVTLTSSTGMAVTGTLSATGVISSTTTGGLFTALGASTNSKYLEFQNTGGTCTMGVESSAGGVIITGSSAYDASLSGQTGIAFSANNGGAMHMRLSTNGLCIGGQSVANLTWAGGAVTPQFSVETTATYNILQSKSYNSAAPSTSGMLVLGKSRGAIGVQTQTNNGDSLGYISFEGVNSSNAVTGGAYITVKQTAAAGASFIGAEFEFFAGTSSVAIAQIGSWSATGLVIGSPTGGSQGAGTINATGLYVNGVAVGGSGFSTTDDTTTNTTYYPVFVTTIAGSTAKMSSTKLNFNPSTGTLSATIVTTLSDAKMKDNIAPITDAVETVNKLEGVSFNWKDTGAKSYGVVAQELEKVLPELVYESDGLKTVNYSGLIGFLINTIKELDARVKQLENK